MDEDQAAEFDRAMRGDSIEAVMAELSRDGDPDPQLANDLLEMAAGKAHSDAAGANLALDVCERIATETDAPEIIAESTYLRARLALNGGQPDQALALIAKSRETWQAIGRPLEASRTELGRMHVLDDLGRHGEAAAAAQELLRDLDGHDEETLDTDQIEQLDWMRAAANENLGVAYGFTGQHERALSAYEAAEKRYELVGGEPDLARCRGNRGIELVAIGRAVEGLETLESAAGMFQNLNDQLSYAQCLGHVADAELLLGLYAASLTRFHEARAILEDLGARSEVCRLRLKTVRAYLALNLIDEAEREAAETELVLAELALDHDLAEARWLRAIAELQMGRPEEARSRLEQAIEGATTSDDPPLLAKVLLTMSQAFEALGQDQQSLAASERALVVVGGGEWPAEELHVRLRMAQLVDDNQEVEVHLATAERLADELRLPHLSYPVLLELGRHNRRTGGIGDARRWLRAAVDVVESLRGLIPDEALRTSYLEGRTAAHVDLMSMLIADGDEQDRLVAFDLAEASKGRTLSDILAGVVQPGTDDAGPDESLSLDKYEADLDAAYGALASGVLLLSDSRRELVEHRAIELERALRLAHLRSAAGTAKSGLKSTEDVISVRPRPNEQVIEYHVLGDEVVAFVWSHGRLQLVTDLASISVVSDLLARWDRQRERFQLAGSLGVDDSGQLLRPAEDLLRQLWAATFGPVSDLLDPSDDHLLVIPHGPLHGIPFHALIGPDGAVGRSWTIAIAPSYAVAARLGTPAQIGSGIRSLVVGVPDEAAPAVEREARFVAEILPGAELLIGEQATLAAFMEKASERCDVLHLACHGLHRSRNPMFSALKLADRWLTARDVLAMSLDDTLVVLSACETGRISGQPHQDEAIGLARSFIAAGASAVVVSLWLAADEVTALLMQHFYQGFGAGLSAPEALRSAQATVAESHPHPAHWAPFVLHGRPRGES